MSPALNTPQPPEVTPSRTSPQECFAASTAECATKLKGLLSSGDKIFDKLVNLQRDVLHFLETNKSFDYGVDVEEQVDSLKQSLHNFDCINQVNLKGPPRSSLWDHSNCRRRPIRHVSPRGSGFNRRLKPKFARRKAFVRVDNM